MTAHPKRKMTQSRKRNRRSQDRVTVGSIILCRHCRQPHLAHHVCPTCGYYAGREVIPNEETAS